MSENPNEIARCQFRYSKSNDPDRIWDYRFDHIADVLKCHALGAEVIARKWPEGEKAQAEHALGDLQSLKDELAEPPQEGE